MPGIANDPYKIAADQRRNRLSICCPPAFWDVQTVDRFFMDTDDARRQLDRPEQATMLVDLRDAIIQTAMVIERVKVGFHGQEARRIALVAATPTARMQTKRLRLENKVECYASMDAAEKWLSDLT